jgi:hypothetical protein
VLYASAAEKEKNTLNAPRGVLYLRIPAVMCSEAGCQFPTGREWGWLITMTFARSPVFKSG